MNKIRPFMFTVKLAQEPKSQGWTICVFFWFTDNNFTGSYNVNVYAKNDDTSYCNVSTVQHLNDKPVEITEMTRLESVSRERHCLRMP